MQSLSRTTQVTRICWGPWSTTVHSINTQTATAGVDFGAVPKDYNQIPKPGVITFLRDFMPGGKFNDTSFFDYALEMRKRYGDIFVMPGMFGKPDLVMLYNTKDFETVIRNEGEWPIRKGLDSIRHYREKVKGDFFGESFGLPVSQSEQWGKLRSAVNPILMKPRNMEMYLEPLQNINDQFVRRIKEIRNVETLEVPKDFVNDIYRLAFESVALIALDKKLGLVRNSVHNPDAERLFECSRIIFELAYKLDFQPSMWKIIRTPTFYQSMKCQDELFNITNKFIDEALAKIERNKSEGNSSHASVLERLLVMDKKTAVVIAMDMLFAGVDATSVTIAAILLCLAKNADKQNILRQEVLKVLPHKHSQLEESDMKHLPYLRAVIKEAMRFYPNGTGTMRTSVKDLVLAGYRVPKGSNIVMNSNILTEDDAFYPQAKQFIPERWLRDNNNKKIDFDPFSFLPFGIGPRICIGKRLVEMELEVTLLKLIRNFHVEFDYDASKPFKATFVNAPAIPLTFKFKDVQQ